MKWFYRLLGRKEPPVQTPPETPQKSQPQWRHGVAGNITKTHYDEKGILRYGSKAFCGGTKVYLYGKFWPENYDEIGVIGLNRFKRWVWESVPVALIENVRYTRVYKPGVLKRMEIEEAIEGADWWKRTAQDKREALAFVQTWNERRSKEAEG